MISNRKEFEGVFLKYYNPLCNFCQRYIQDSDEVQDVVQDVFEKLWTKREAITFDKPIQYYLFTSVKNRAIEKIRKKKRGAEIIDNLDVPTQTEVIEEDTDQFVRKEMLYNAIRELPPKCQEVFKMSKIDGLTYNEIAAEMDISVKTVENQMRRAFQILRKLLNNSSHG